ncbi:glyoxalase [Achromobacter sp. MYb9]|uniref:VOC family protein n=1 Tax=Achromobacter sp. MYb9 TaxID=1827284 RepID=UPI000CFA8ADC|nr:VOC family protein [Achromobacter sp. MYb9]PQZ61914.1 glyoxalase [Achromobacter sp. MYb9]
MTSCQTMPGPLRLHGVDHTARPTWRLRATVAFYRDILGLPLVHVISARGWGPRTHPDFLHFFFDSGQGSTIAFFYYLGSEEPEFVQGRSRMRPLPDDHIGDATHTAWLVQSEDELKAWKKKLEDAGLEVSVETRHEVIESIYVRDPNGYFIEFTRKLRPLGKIDALDADLTLQAAIQAEDEALAAGTRISHIDGIWARKAALVEALQSDHDGKRPGVRIFVPRVEEFAPLVRDAEQRDDCAVVQGEYFDCIQGDAPLEFRRKTLGLKPAVWYGLFTGGVSGTIAVLDRDHVRIEPMAA